MADPIQVISPPPASPQGPEPEQTPPESARLEDDDLYPALFRRTDQRAIAARRRQRLWAMIEPTLITAAGSLVVLGSLVGEQHRRTVAILAIFPLVATLALRLFGHRWSSDRAWYDARSIAETVKSQSWRFMMRIPPYERDDDAGAAFGRVLAELAAAAPYDRQPSAGGDETAAATPFMRQIRASPLAARRAAYADARLRDQIRWYARRASHNRTAGTRWFWFATVAQVAAVLAGIARAIDPANVNLVPLLAGLAVAATIWSHSSRHYDLAKTYGRVRDELAAIEDVVSRATTEEELAEAVRRGEEACSSEHARWIITRGGAPAPV